MILRLGQAGELPAGERGDSLRDTPREVIVLVSAEAVVAGDIVYNNVHMMQFEADDAAREAWIASLDAIAALDPKIVVAGHKRAGSPDWPGNIAASQQYLRDFSRIAGQGGTVEDLVNGMTNLHGDRDNPHTPWIPARAEAGRRP